MGAGRFDNLGNKMTFDRRYIDLLDIGLLLFWVFDADEFVSTNPNMEVSVSVVFSDGFTGYETVVFDPSNIVVHHYVDYDYIRDDANAQLRSLLDYYLNIPLEECELVPDSVSPVVDGIFSYEIGDKRYEVNVLEITMLFEYDGIRRIVRGESTFNEDNTRRISFGDNAGSDDEMGYLAIIKRDVDGSMTGMVFRTPKRMG